MFVNTLGNSKNTAQAAQSMRPATNTAAISMKSNRAVSMQPGQMEGGVGGLKSKEDAFKKDNNDDLVSVNTYGVGEGQAVIGG